MGAAGAVHLAMLSAQSAQGLWVMSARISLRLADEQRVVRLHCWHALAAPHCNCTTFLPMFRLTSSELVGIYDWQALAAGGNSARCPWYYPGLLKASCGLGTNGSGISIGACVADLPVAIRPCCQPAGCDWPGCTGHTAWLIRVLLPLVCIRCSMPP